MVAQLESPILKSASVPPYHIEGLIQIFTGSHRNFFTGVISQGFRVAGQGTSVLVVQFLKGGIKQGHDRPIQLGKNLDWLRCDVPRCIDTPHLEEEENQALQQLWNHTQTVVKAGQYSLVVLDELSLAINLELIPLQDVVTFLNQRPPSVDIILTGPDMPPELLDLADQITEIRRSHQP